jgi:aryl-alcohol dehydrogenase-like predicted oxidoreductase
LVPLGQTGLKVTRLAQGTGFNGYNHSSEHTRRGKEAFDRLARHSLDQGIAFFDMADLYGSHPFVKDVIKGLPRDKFTLLSKIWPRKEGWVTPSGGAKEEVDRFRKELDTDRLDVCLIHCMQNAKWADEYERIRDGLSELKQKKIVRAVGVSCHDLGALKVASQHAWVDVIFARINHKGGSQYVCDGSVEEVSAVLKTARANGKAVVGMKIFAAGKFANQPEEKDASLKYVFTNRLVDAITVGMLTTEEVDDTLKRMSAVTA